MMSAGEETCLLFSESQNISLEMRQLPEVLEQLHSDALCAPFTWGVSPTSGADTWSWFFTMPLVLQQLWGRTRLGPRPLAELLVKDASSLKTTVSFGSSLCLWEEAKSLFCPFAGG